MVSNKDRKMYILLTLLLAATNVFCQEYYVPQTPTTPEPPSPDLTTLPGTSEDEDGLTQYESDSDSLSQNENDQSTTNTNDDEDGVTTTMSSILPAPEFTSKRFFKLNDKFTVFNELLDKDLEPKGYPFPEIYGPAPWERVCIVGAGPAGVHMSLSLKKKGYKNVTIFEKTARVGGKSYDVNLGGGSYLPQGAFAFSSEYFDTLVALAEEYGVGEYEKIPEFGVRLILSDNFDLSQLFSLR